eukprot:TRINITY_DN129_c0_g1_i1.p1 TRINITY_DN129_c0_g1~~TRINITY_DN129_c0_g1_i1.p1  ORF type:complete len:221 (-),score=6.07 TRINITY_DN129_c0_g1_i1:157-819(-)
MEFDTGFGTRNLNPEALGWVIDVFHDFFLRLKNDPPSVYKHLVEYELNSLGFDSYDYILAWKGPVSRFVRKMSKIMRRRREKVNFFWGHLYREDVNQQIISSLEQFMEDSLIQFQKGNFVNEYGWLINFDRMYPHNPHVYCFEMKIYIPKREYTRDVMQYLEKESKPEDWTLKEETIEELIEAKKRYASDIMDYLEKESNPEDWMLTEESLDELLASNSS